MFVRYNRLFSYFEWLGHLGQWELNTAFGFFLMPQTPGCTWQLTIFLNRCWMKHLIHVWSALLTISVWCHVVNFELSG